MKTLTELKDKLNQSLSEHLHEYLSIIEKNCLTCFTELGYKSINSIKTKKGFITLSQILLPSFSGNYISKSITFTLKITNKNKEEIFNKTQSFAFNCNLYQYSNQAIQLEMLSQLNIKIQEYLDKIYNYLNNLKEEQVLLLKD
jgi:hypothetical protein